MQLEAEEIMKIHVRCSRDIEVKNDGSGYLRVIPIIGGRFEGKISGSVVPVGADFNTSKENQISHVFAKYVLQADNGDYIAIENAGKIHAGSQNRIKTIPTFQVCDTSVHSWLNTGVYAGELAGGNIEGQVEIVIYKLA